MNRPASPRALFPGKVADAATDRHLREHRAEIDSLRASPAINARILANVTLADGVDTPLSHGLGRAPSIVLVSPPRGPATAGLIEDVRTLSTFPRSTYVVLKASGFGADVVVDVEVK